MKLSSEKRRTCSSKSGMPWMDSTRALKLKDSQTLIQLTSEYDREAPFTIQRLAELAAYPSRHYKSSIKYLRALRRTLQVSSGSSSFAMNTYALSPGLAEATLLGHASTTFSNSTRPLLRSSVSPAASPLLSPIPWITSSSSFDDSDSDDLHLESLSSSPHTVTINGHDASLAEGGSPSLPTASPTGGRVDEVSLSSNVALPAHNKSPFSA